MLAADSWCTLFLRSEPITGNWRRAELTMSSCRPGWPSQDDADHGEENQQQGEDGQKSAHRRSGRPAGRPDRPSTCAPPPSGWRSPGDAAGTASTRSTRPPWRRSLSPSDRYPGHGRRVGRGRHPPSEARPVRAGRTRPASRSPVVVIHRDVGQRRDPGAGRPGRPRSTSPSARSGSLVTLPLAVWGRPCGDPYEGGDPLGAEVGLSVQEGGRTGRGRTRWPGSISSAAITWSPERGSGTE